MSEEKSALNTIKTERQQVDLVVFDACLMGMTEVAYEIKDLANVMVASEETEPGDGWPDTVLDEFLSWYYGAGGEITLLPPDNGAVLPESSPAIFAWEADATYRFKIQFSPTSLFPRGFPTLTVPKRFWMPNTLTDSISVDAWQRIWEIIKRIEQMNGIVYWRVLGKPGPTAHVELSEIRNFMIE